MNSRRNDFDREERKGVSWWYVILTVLVVFSVFLAMSVVFVKYDRVKVVKQFGALTGTVFDEGLSFKAIWQGTESVYIQTKVYETSENPDDSDADYTDYIVTAQTVDGQQIGITYSVRFEIPRENAASTLRRFGNMKQIVEKVVKAHSRNLSRDLVQNYEAGFLYSGEGFAKYQESVSDVLSIKFEADGIKLVDFLLRKISFDTDYVQTMENKQIAYENITTARYNSEAAEYEKQRQIQLAQAEAERTRLLANAEADNIKILADAEAYSLQSQGSALKKYPEMLQLKFVENLSDKAVFLPSSGLEWLMPTP